MASAQRPPEVDSYTEFPQRSKAYVPSKTVDSDYPLIDNDPHIKRVIKYARPSDYAAGGALAASAPGLFYLMERLSPSYVSGNGFASTLRLSGILGVTGGFFFLYSRSVLRFWGWSENRREIDMDMREMTDRVKRGEPLYGRSSLSEYMQAAASRQSRYAALYLHAIPWFNFVNHPFHGVDTAKYYQNAERELEAERNGSSS